MIALLLVGVVAVSGIVGYSVHSDTDSDYITTYLEVFEYKTNPFNEDSDGDGIDDFNEIFTYPHLLNPNDPTDAEEFIKMIPTVEAKAWRYCAGGTRSSGSRKAVLKAFEISKKDPLVQWYANHTQIVWNTTNSDSWGHVYENAKIGKLKIDGEPFYLGAPEWYNNPYAPISEELKHYGYPNTAYFLTHGRKGTCADTAENLKVILELRGYESIVVPGSMSPSLGHPWVETNIDGEIYVADYNKLIPRDEFYEKKQMGQR